MGFAETRGMTGTYATQVLGSQGPGGSQQGSGRGSSGRPWPFRASLLADRIAAANLAPKAAVEALIFEARAADRLLVDLIVERGLVGAEQLRDLMSTLYSLPMADLGTVWVDPALVSSFPAELARRHMLLPLSREGTKLVVATLDPTNAEGIRAAHRMVGYTFDLRLATRADLEPLVATVFGATARAVLPSGEVLTVAIPPGDTKVGRADHNDVVLPDATLSSTHAVIRSRDGHYQIIDFGSRNGVFVNGARIAEPYELHSGDVVRLGQSSLTFELPGRPADAPVVDEDVEDPETPEEREERKREKERVRMKAAWIAFASRIIAQAIGAAAMILLGLLISGGLPTSCG
jgi:pSer/pThr/pTyr-binding forkhead associated (FHA) protein